MGRQKASWGVLVSSIIMLVFTAVFLLSNFVYAEDNQTKASEGETLVTIHEGGLSTVVVVPGGTIEDALKKAGVEVDESDNVEPGLEQELIASEYRVNIYRSRPVVIVDNFTKHQITTALQTPSQIVEEAGIKVRSEDKLSIQKADLFRDGAGLKVVIERAKPIKVSLFGKETTMYTHAETVEDFLVEKEIELGPNDRASIPLNERIDGNETLKIWREGHQTITVEEEVGFTVRNEYDADRPVGYSEIKQNGVVGSKLVTYDIVITDGEITEREVVSEVITKQPVDQIKVLGSKYIATTPSQNEAIAWNFFIEKGFTPEQAAGIMGNLQQEHRFNTSDVPGGLGIAQWLGGRRAALMQWENYLDIHTQLNFMMYEFNNKEYRAYNAIKRANTIEEATRAFQNHYERCGICREQTRISYAHMFYARYR